MRDVESAHVSASASDRGSDGIDVETAVGELVERWGLGGALVELQQLGPLPAEAAELVAPLAMVCSAYAPPASVRAGWAWRSAPCPLCDVDEGGPARG
ncbi:hypothetical protein ACL02T_12680 [Pseudonocardia sp. RS010]|uniref:hypothetical protein n=1 Tax=Pseudonocardia sp. RS010 TaxID=3385979 RepID=UPI0039A01304